MNTKPVFWENKKHINSLSFAELAQRVVTVKHWDYSMQLPVYFKTYMQIFTHLGILKHQKKDIIGSGHSMSYNIACEPSEDTYQTAHHSCSQIRVFAGQYVGSQRFKVSTGAQLSACAG